ncbi:MAG: ATP-binding protein [bacterium]|nr:ATP-binding protein [bacterium]
MKSFIHRDHYLGRIKPFMEKELIKVIIGQRRVGKSYFLYEIMDELTRRGVKEEQMLSINKESYDWDHVRDNKDLIKAVEKHFGAKKAKRYLFIDEVQDIQHFEKALRSLQQTGQYDLYITGSNAFMVSSELATYLGGRHISFEIFSLSYPEFLRFHQMEKGTRSFFQYLQYGGMPYLIHIEKNDEVVYQYLSSVYNSILLQDIVERYGIRQVDFLNRLVLFLADNVGSFVSAKSISDYLKAQHMNLSPSVVLNYLQYIISSFYLYEAKRSDISGKKIFQIQEKYYFGDLGFRHALIGYRQTDINKMLENVVYLHLKREGYQITVGKQGEKEIDFIAQKGDEKLSVQVCYLLTNQKVRDREFGNLLEIKDNYRKIVLSMDEGAGGNIQGVEHQHVIDFLTTP